MHLRVIAGTLACYLEADNSIIIAAEQGGNERILTTRKYPKVFGDEVSWSPDGKLI